MMHTAWSSIVEVPYCFSRSYVKLQGHTALKIVKFDPNWAFPDCNSSLNSWMAMKCCTKLETVKERCPFVFQGHPSYFKVTQYKTSPILTQIGHFRTIGRSQLSNPSDLPCYETEIHVWMWSLYHSSSQKRVQIIEILSHGSEGPRYACQCHGYWCAGSLHCQGISSHNIILISLNILTSALGGSTLLSGTETAIAPGYLCQYHGSRCPGSLRPQVISSNDIECKGKTGPCLPRGSIPATCVISLLRNYRKCKYDFIQSGAIIAQSNIVRYYINNYRNWGRISVRCWMHKRPNGRAMGCFLWIFVRQFTGL